MESLPTSFCVIGLDPGRSTGICKYSPQLQKMLEFLELDFWGTIQYLAEIDPENCLVIVENPNLNAPPLFGAKIPTSKMQHGTQLKRAESVGRNKEQAYQIIEWLKLYDYAHVGKRPVKKPKRPSGKTKGKWSMQDFTAVTGWSVPLSEHQIDAGLLVFGINEALALLQYNILRAG